MVSWAVKILEYDIKYVPRGRVKSKSQEDFMETFSSFIDEETPPGLALSVNGASNVKGSGTGIVLEGSSNILIE